MTSTITPLLQRFSEGATAVKDELKTYATCDPDGFRTEALPLVRGVADEGGRRYVFHLLLKHAGLAKYLADPSQSTMEDAVAVAKAAFALGVPLDAALENMLGGLARDNSAGPKIIRIIDLFAALSLGKLVLRFQKELIAHLDPLVCSKVIFELVKAGKGPSLVAQILLQGDPRVQANAVEALWDVQDTNARPVLLIAAKSPHNCVAANGLMGLYRHGDLESIPQMLRMAAHADPAQRSSAMWVIGETKDPRFLPFLTGEFSKTDGKEKLGIVRALARIRKHLRDREVAGKVHITLHEARILPDGSRRIVVALRIPNEELAALLPTQFALWEDNALVTRYSARCVASPHLLILGFAVPRFSSKADPYAEAVSRALNACAGLKRSADHWCLDRYLVDDQSRAAAKEQFVDTEDRSPLALHIKKYRGFTADPEFIQEQIRELGVRERTPLDVVAAVDKLVEITSRAAGPRHLFVFFDPQDLTDNIQRRLAMALRDESVTVHGFAPSSEGDSAALQRLCTGSNQGTFHEVPMDEMERAVTEVHLGLMDRYEIVYRVDGGPKDAPRCELRISTQTGTGLLSCCPSL